VDTRAANRSPSLAGVSAGAAPHWALGGSGWPDIGTIKPGGRQAGILQEVSVESTRVGVGACELSELRDVLPTGELFLRPDQTDHSRLPATGYSYSYSYVQAPS
jgi:hypothetical protein